MRNALQEALCRDAVMLGLVMKSRKEIEASQLKSRRVHPLTGSQTKVNSP